MKTTMSQIESVLTECVEALGNVDYRCLDPEDKCPCSRCKSLTNAKALLGDLHQYSASQSNGVTKVNYSIMTDRDGVMWKVPTHIDEQPVLYLEKHNPLTTPHQ